MPNFHRLSVLYDEISVSGQLTMGQVFKGNAQQKAIRIRSPFSGTMQSAHKVTFGLFSGSLILPYENMDAGSVRLFPLPNIGHLVNQ